jgi:hypothetical protein
MTERKIKFVIPVLQLQIIQLPESHDMKNYLLKENISNF